jgi:hypothetical protein
VCTVDESQALFGGEGERLNAGTFEQWGRGDSTTVDKDVPFTDQDIGDGGERGKIAGSTD